MAECKLISPLLDDFIVGESISDHNGVRCYPAMKNGSNTRYILKVISIPASYVQLDALLLSGAYQSREDAIAYFGQLAKDVSGELEILNRMAKQDGFVTYEASQVCENAVSSGFDIYLLGTYKHNLERHFRKYPMTHLAAVNLGLDICAALAACRQAGFLYADLKPGNIFITEDNKYHIGDLGFLPILGLKYASLPDRYRSSYTAPELADPFAQIKPSMDIYAAGLILYQAYNGGVLPFTGTAPSEPLAPPLYADYEMAEIILKACSPDPAERWEDPMKMGQALVGYMQRNSINDDPIVPPLAELEPEDKIEAEEVEEAEAEASEEQAADPDQIMINEMLDIAGEEDPANLAFLDDMNTDETVPQEETASEVVYQELTDDVSNMLEQADDLIAHEAPAPAVAPEAIDVPVPEAEETSNDDSVDEAVAAITEAVAGSEEPVRDDQAMLEIAQDTDEAEVAAEAIPEEAEFEDEEERKPKKSIVNKILASLLALIILSCITVAGFLFYRDYYIKTIDTLLLEGADDQLTVYLSTKADHSLLQVVCTDTYGNKIKAPVENGFSTFSDLTPDMLYTITVEIEGFHGVKGNCRTTYTTAPRTEVVSFNAVTGAESGTVILNFTVKGYDFSQWTLSYVAEGEVAQSTTFSGHMVTVNGLTVGKTYTFTLDIAGTGYVIGQSSLDFAVTELVYATDLEATAFSQDGLTVVWNEPEGTEVSSWTVLCYNDTGYSQNVTTAENTAQFTGIDPTASYTVEVTAAGMSVGERYYISKNAVSVSDFTTKVNGGGMDIVWNYSGTPASNWVLTYTIGSSTMEISAPTNGAAAHIDAIVPGQAYNFKLHLQDGTTVVNSVHTVELDEAQSFEGYGVSTNGMVWRMCLAPSGNNWGWWNVQSYQTSFAAGQKAGFVVRLTNLYSRSDDVINVVYAISNADGEIVSVNNTSMTWTSMWWDLNYGWQNQGEFNVPTLPVVAGEYTMDIFFNGAFVHQQAFTIKE